MGNKLRNIALIAAVIMLMPLISEARNRKQSDRKQEIGIIAHRGFWNCDEAGYTNNSISALRCAQEAGFWGSEFDVNMTKDSILIVYHDSSVRDKKIEKHPYKTFSDFRLENGEPIPTIDEYLEQGKKYPETMLVYELKKHSSVEIEDIFVDLTIEKLKEHGLLDPSRVMFISFSFHMCQRLAEKLPEFTVQYLTGDKKPAKLKKAGISGIDYNHVILSVNKKWVRQAQTKDMSVNAWTVNKENTLRNMISLGVKYITTDNPVQTRELLSEMNIPEMR